VLLGTLASVLAVLVGLMNIGIGFFFVMSANTLHDVYYEALGVIAAGSHTHVIFGFGLGILGMAVLITGIISRRTSLAKYACIGFSIILMLLWILVRGFPYSIVVILLLLATIILLVLSIGKREPKTS